MPGIHPSLLFFWITFYHLRLLSLSSYRRSKRARNLLSSDQEHIKEINRRWRENRLWHERARIQEPVILCEPHIITSHKWRTAGSLSLHLASWMLFQILNPLEDIQSHITDDYNKQENEIEQMLERQTMVYMLVSMSSHLFSSGFSISNSPLFLL